MVEWAFSGVKPCLYEAYIEMVKVTKRTGKPASDAGDAAHEEHFRDLSPAVQAGWALFLKAYKVVLETVDRETRKGGPVSLAEFELLLYIEAASGRIRYVNLAKLSLLSEAQISRRVSLLQEKGYLRREATDRDRRATYAVITEQGIKALHDAQKPFLASLHKNFVQRIPGEKLAVFNEVLESLVNDPRFPEEAGKLLK